MVTEIDGEGEDRVEGIFIRACRGDIGIEVPIYRVRFDKCASFELDEQRIKIPADITGYDAKPDGWLALALITAPDFLIATAGDLLAVRRTPRPRNGQIAIIRHAE